MNNDTHTTPLAIVPIEHIALHALDLVREAAFLMDDNGCFLYVNLEACRSLGYSRDELIGMSIPDIDPDYSLANLPLSRNQLLTSGFRTFETRHRTKDGRVFPVEITSSRFEHEGSPYTLALVRNIAERKSTEESMLLSEQKYRTLAENSPDNIVRYDRECRAIYCNPALQRTVALDYELLLGKTPVELGAGGPQVAAEFEGMIRRVAATGEPDEMELVMPHPSGELHTHLVRFVAERDGEGQIIGVLAIGRDINERKLAENEVRRLNAELEERVQERTAQLAQANARLQELDRIKSMFIASMSHELRTPLNSVIGFSRILLNEWLGPLNAEQKENLAIVLKSGKHLLSLINDIIDVSKIEAGLAEPHPEEFDIYDVVAEAVTTFVQNTREKGVELKVQAIHHQLHTDRTRLLQCLLNLVGNAVKYTERGVITIRAEVPIGNERLVLSVTDTGIGIGEEDLGKLFAPFVRLDSPLKSTVPGNGLGLYLTRKLVEGLLQGEVTVASTPGAGSLFALTVPLQLTNVARIHEMTGIHEK